MVQAIFAHCRHRTGTGTSYDLSLWNAYWDEAVPVHGPAQDHTGSGIRLAMRVSNAERDCMENRNR